MEMKIEKKNHNQKSVSYESNQKEGRLFLYVKWSSDLLELLDSWKKKKLIDETLFSNLRDRQTKFYWLLILIYIRNYMALGECHFLWSVSPLLFIFSSQFKISDCCLWSQAQLLHTATTSDFSAAGTCASGIFQQ